MACFDSLLDSVAKKSHINSARVMVFGSRHLLGDLVELPAAQPALVRLDLGDVL